MLDHEDVCGVEHIWDHTMLLPACLHWLGRMSGRKWSFCVWFEKSVVDIHAHRKMSHVLLIF